GSAGRPDATVTPARWSCARRYSTTSAAASGDDISSPPVRQGDRHHVLVLRCALTRPNAVGALPIRPWSPSDRLANMPRSVVLSGESVVFLRRSRRNAEQVEDLLGVSVTCGSSGGARSGC